MEELTKSILTMLFAASGFILGAMWLVGALVMASNVKEGESFSITNILPVISDKALNEKGKAARKYFNFAYFGLVVWGIGLYASWKYFGNGT